jgi:hypothetical protein
MIEEKDRLVWSGVFLGFARALVAVEKLGDDASHHQVCLAIHDEFQRQRRIFWGPQDAEPLPDKDC